MKILFVILIVKLLAQEGVKNSSEQKQQKSNESSTTLLDYNPMADILKELGDGNGDFEDNPFLKLLGPLLGLLDQNTAQIDENELNELNTDELLESLKKYQNQTFNKFQRKIIDFQPDDLISFEVDQSEILYEDIKTPTNIRGTFFVSPYTNDKIKLVIKGLDNAVIYSKEGTEDVFDLQLHLIGEYKFIFTNKNSDPVLVTFALDVHNAHTDYLTFVDLDPVHQRVERLHIAIKDQYFASKLSQMYFSEGSSALVTAHNKLLIFTFIESLSILGLTIWQVVYLKRILSYEKMI